MRTGNKRKAQIRHAKIRALARYDLDLRDSDLDNIVKLIQNKGAKFLAHQSNNFSIYQLTYQSCDVKVVYDRKRKSIVTFIPKEADYS